MNDIQRILLPLRVANSTSRCTPQPQAQRHRKRPAGQTPFQGTRHPILPAASNNHPVPSVDLHLGTYEVFPTNQ